MMSMGSLECVGLIHASPSSTSKSLQERVKGLEEERKKIEAFKRELPLCMQLLNHAIEASKERLGVQKPSLLKIPPDFQAVDSVYPTQRHPHRMKDKEEKAIEEDQDNLIRSYIKERNPTIWTPLLVSMGSQQQSLEKERFVSSDGKVSSKIQRPHEFDQTFGSASKPKLGGAFSPFQKKRKQEAIPKSESAKDAAADLTLGPSSQGSVDCRKNCSGKLGQIHGPNIKKGRSKDAIMVDLDQQSKERTTSSSSNCLHHTGAGLYPQKKGRRCWSPELHSTFLNALHELGGPQVATPKQIKELMKVEGLTNDEVKSHLQKYRLHMRRPSPTQQSAASTPQLVHVVGGIWMPPLIPPQHPMPPPTLVYTHPNLHLCQNPINPTIAQVYHEGHQASPMGLSSSEAQAHSINEGIEGNGGETSSSQHNSQPIDCEEDEEEDEEEELRDTQDSCANQLCAGSSTTNY